MKYLTLVLFVALSATRALSADPREADWAKVDAASAAEQPRTAIAALDKIVSEARSEGAYPELIKAIAMRTKLLGDTQGTLKGEQIRQLEAAFKAMPEQSRPLIELVLAHAYWRYLESERDELWNRSKAVDFEGALETWDRARVVDEISRHFEDALRDPDALKSTPLTDFAPLLDRGNVPPENRPTAFDFIAFEALKFYSVERGADSSAEEFAISNDGAVFRPGEEFMVAELPRLSSDSPIFKSLRLYQALLRFHAHDKDRSAFLETDFARLQFAGTLTREKLAPVNEAALRRFIQQAGTHEISARAMAHLAQQLEDSDNAAASHVLAREAIARLPSSVGATLCENLIHKIEKPSATLRTEWVWNAPWPTIDITYRNVTTAYFRAVPLKFESCIGVTRFAVDRIEDIEPLLKRKPALEWSCDLPATKDFKKRTEHLSAPETLPPGLYALLVSHDPAFPLQDSQLSATVFWVSDLALIVKRRRTNLSHSPAGLVVNARTGEPIQGATVRFWAGEEEVLPERTDEYGQFKFPSEECVALVEYGGHSVCSSWAIDIREATPEPVDEVLLFTDRSIYRPNEVIHYKGVRVAGSYTSAAYDAVPEREVEVLLRDQKREVVSRAKHTTNALGAFSGTFVAPEGANLGRYAIEAVGCGGQAAIRVEEYKRSKFSLQIAGTAAPPRLGETVSIRGTAIGYNGAPVANAKVTWSVDRTAGLADWCWWWQGRFSSSTIDQGTLMTDSEGAFTIDFNAMADPAAETDLEPSFRFSTEVHVTDSSGETRHESHTITVGYAAVDAFIGADKWQTSKDPVRFTVETASLDGLPVSTKALLTVSALKQPSNVTRHPSEWPYGKNSRPGTDPWIPESWEDGEMVHKQPIATDHTGRATVDVPLPAGIYRARMETADDHGAKVTARHIVQVLDRDATRFPIKVATLLIPEKTSLVPGETFTALWGTGYDFGRALIEIECNGKLLQRYWTAPDRTQELIQQPVTEELRGGFQVRVIFFRENRSYAETHVIEVPWSNKSLSLRWESFRSNLLPGSQESWTATITDREGKPATAEMVATLYDASLDQFREHKWTLAHFFRCEFPEYARTENDNAVRFHRVVNWPDAHPKVVSWDYPAFDLRLRSVGLGEEDVLILSPFSVDAIEDAGFQATAVGGNRIRTQVAIGRSSISDAGKAATEIKLAAVAARRNLQETAFFYPHLLTDDSGRINIQFTVPEALTRWKFLGFAHDAQLRSGLLTGEAVTAKELMVQPNPPRFVREGDELEFTVKVSNRSKSDQRGTTRLTFANAATGTSFDAELANQATDQPFSLAAGESRTFSWKIRVPDEAPFLTFKAVAASDTFSDGEEAPLPVLSRHMLVTESLPLSIRGNSSRNFAFDHLLKSADSSTLRHHALTVEMVSQPVWYAVLSLPYLMEFPHECSEQLFNRAYANLLGRRIVTSDPSIERIFSVWRATRIPESPLEKNQQLKSIAIEETPWVRRARSEAEARRTVALRFDSNRLQDETSRALSALAARQLKDGMWPWFPGGPGSEYISLYVTAGYGRLRHLGIEVDMAPALRALAALEENAAKEHQRILRRAEPDAYIPTASDAFYLYTRSFFLKERPLSGAAQEAVNFLLRQAKTGWLSVGSRQTQAHLALALKRFGDAQTAEAILRSLKERSANSEEFGMYWEAPRTSWWWYEAPIETQALMIEAFEEVSQDREAVEACKVWLLKQKQAQDWGTTKATADAVYALLLRGSPLLRNDAVVQVSLDGVPVKPAATEAGTAYYEHRLTGPEIKPAMGRITVTKRDEGVSWGAVHWQYFEDISKVPASEGTALKIKKALFTKEMTAQGPVLKPVTGPVHVGDELVVRIELRTDRDLEFVHLKDRRGSGVEPVDVLSEYRRQGRLWYYQSTRDTATHFFFDWIGKGTYVFEYSTRVQLRGTYETNIAEIQCMYAPEFNSHSESTRLTVE